MAARTFTSAGVDNLWTNAANWDTAPVDNDSVTIPNGQTCEYDGDMSNAVTWPNGIAGITVTGTLKLTRTTGTYYLKIKAAATIGGAGTFDCGTSGDAIPFAAKHTITGGTAWYIKGNDGAGLTMTVYAAEPAIKTILLSGDEAIGQTELSVDTDVTSDVWADGDTVRIDDINKAAESEERVIAAGGRAAGAITITAGLTAAKSTGAYLHLITRNVKFIGVGASGFVARYFTAGKLTVAGGQWTTATYRAFDSCAGASISGGTFSGNNYVMIACSSSVISGGIFSGNASNVVQATYGVRISGGTFTGNVCVVGNNTQGCTISGGTFAGNEAVVSQLSGFVVFGGTFKNNTYGISNSSGTIKNAQFTDNSYDLYTTLFTCFNVLLGSTTEVGQYTRLAKECYSESIDHDQSAGAFKAWTRGGVTSSQIVTKPTGYTSAMQTVLEDANNEGFWQKEVLVAAGASVSIVMNLRKSASMVYLPRVIIFNKALTDPFAGGTGIHTFTMTDSVDTWEAETYTYSNDTANDVTLIIRTQGKNASGNVFSALTVNVINVDLTSVIAMLTDLHDTDLPAVSTKVDTVDTVVDAIKLKTDNLPVDPADESLLEAAIAAIPTAPTVDNIWDEVVEGTYTARELMRLISAAMAGKASGGGTGTITFRNLNDTANRIVATVDIDGNRSVMVLNP